MAVIVTIYWRPRGYLLAQRFEIFGSSTHRRPQPDPARVRPSTQTQALTLPIYKLNRPWRSFRRVSIGPPATLMLFLNET